MTLKCAANFLSINQSNGNLFPYISSYESVRGIVSSTKHETEDSIKPKAGYLQTKPDRNYFQNTRLVSHFSEL